MWSLGSSVGGRHSVPELTRDARKGSLAVGSVAPTARTIALRYSTPEGPGHWPEGSDDRFVKGLPITPKLVIFIWTSPARSTAPGPEMSGTAAGCATRAAEASALAVEPERTTFAGKPGSANARIDSAPGAADAARRVDASETTIAPASAI